ncbi:hypothetical protein PSH28_07365 [Pseudomonas resinovorans]|uniref:hypothetical protein n=1 Tax=Metapseudomonas resinovorans TaxID=53412 RepID=UPI00237EFDDF|nr:hypothetical protein [Pseudomonas resinovorans]MDE3736405.1 hypothetical protein [Pseudomonas resinovorans]
MQDVMRCLQEELNDAPADTKAHRILQFMVQAKLAEMEKGRCEPQVFSRSALLLNVEGDLKGQTTNPTTWLPPGLLERFLESRQSALLDRLQRAGQDQMPVIRTNDGKGGKGIERAYWLDVAPLPEGIEADEPVRLLSRIEYRRTEAGEVKPSWLMRLVFRKGELKNRSWRGLLLLASILFGILLLGLWFLVGVWSVSSLDQGLTLRQLASTAFFVLCVWFMWGSFYAPWWRLVDDRVIKAPTALISLLEDSAELEVHRDSEGAQWTRFVRFSGDCPLCTGRVLLMPGEPDQVLPLVGRCVESPYAHVFSFDRVRMQGAFIGPPLI